jgi:hypothetical protein
VTIEKIMCVPFISFPCCRLIELVFGTIAIMVSGGYVIKYLVLASEIGHYPSVLEMLKEDSFKTFDAKHVLYGVFTLFGMFALASALRLMYYTFCGCIPCASSKNAKRKYHTKSKSYCDFGFLEYLFLWFVLNCVLLVTRRMFRNDMDTFIKYAGVNITTNVKTINFGSNEGGYNEFDVGDLVIVCATTLGITALAIAVKMLTMPPAGNEDSDVL